MRIPYLSVHVGVAVAICFPSSSNALSNHHNNSIKNRRTFFQTTIVNTLTIATTVNSNANAVTDEGISAVTDSPLGRTFRRSAIQGARVIDNLDEKWERFSDSLRDESKCDENTGRRLYDNGFRKDGTRIGNPVIGSLCRPEPLMPLDEVAAGNILDSAVRCALRAGAAGGDENALQKSIREVEELVRPSFERTLKNAVDDDDKRRKMYNFATYAKMRAINNALNSPSSIRNFQIEWGRSIISDLAPNANRRNYSSPFPEMKDEFEDYDYDKNLLLDGLGQLKVSLDKLKATGLVGHFEISIPYDDYGSVVTVAIDDYTPIGAEILLAEQNVSIGGPGQALIRAAMDSAGVAYGIDQFYIDPSTTKQSEYNPTQLLISLNNLRRK